MIRQILFNHIKSINLVFRTSLFGISLFLPLSKYPTSFQRTVWVWDLVFLVCWRCGNCEYHSYQQTCEMSLNWYRISSKLFTIFTKSGLPVEEVNSRRSCDNPSCWRGKELVKVHLLTCFTFSRSFKRLVGAVISSILVDIVFDGFNSRGRDNALV